jgi:hypothetical protein
MLDYQLINEKMTAVFVGCAESAHAATIELDFK